MSRTSVRHEQMALALSVLSGLRVRVGADRPSVQVFEADYGAMTNERSLESCMPWTPIDHRARHRSAFAAILAIDEKPEARIVEERDRRSGSEYPLLPMAGVGGDRYQGKHLDTMLLMCFGAFSKPVSNRRASFPVSAVRRIHEDGWIIPRCGQSIGLRQRILYLGAHYGMAIRARVQRDRSAEELLDRVDVLGRRAPMLAQRFRVRASCRHPMPVTSPSKPACAGLAEGYRSCLSPVRSR